LAITSGNCCSTKLAVTAVAADIETTHVPVPEQAPLHPVKVEPALADAVRVTVVPISYASTQSAPQSIPAGTLVTVPAPSAALVTFRENFFRTKVAVTSFAASIVTTQLPVPEQPPPVQPEKLLFVVADAFKVTAAPTSYISLQSAPQSMPAGELDTVPVPLPARKTTKANRLSLKVADIVCDWVTFWKV
jgi:hypothetical protein